ncbi:HAMP domain-containing sensor histidine kinase [Ruminococcus sp. Marseille-P6503]|uniref:sensor histidine kinase n=1 Tax=Ruminococcus sp. Marseille-P6503 TaxID=2364796 RepID=UPI000F537866|nr:HAMP domain-containing sensor histidine kinase [Ruminococcus sp. Marseille-P6503]
MKAKKYKNRRNAAAVVSAAAAVASSAAVYFLCGSWLAAVCAAAGGAAAIACLLYILRLDDAFITDTAADFSRLADCLTELEEREIFPDNEDTAVSKLQNKIIRLVRILKKKNKDSVAEQESIKSLVSDISHQLKTPLANLKMYTDFISDESLEDKERTEYIRIICLSVDRLSFLSESMIKASRLESGLIRLKKEERSLSETVLKAVKDVYAKAVRSGNEILFREEDRVVISHDSGWTSEAVFNLLDNAVKYSPEGGKIYVTVRRLGMFAEVEVRDEGEKIPETEQPKIFSRFYRGSNSRGREGIGIGLYLAREIAVKQGGYINLKSGENGNAFSLYLFQSTQA